MPSFCSTFQFRGGSFPPRSRRAKRRRKRKKERKVKMRMKKISKKRSTDQPSIMQMSCFQRAEAITEASASIVGDEIDHDEQQKILKNRKLWQDSWLRDWDWLEFQHEKGRAFCKFCKMDSKNRSPFGCEGSMNIRTSAFFEHASSDGHRHASWLAVQGGKNSMEKVVKKRRISANASLTNLFRCAYMIAKEDLAFRKFEKLVLLLRACGAKNLTGHYENGKACAKFVNSISKAIEAATCERIRQSPFYGIMVDESTDISTTKHLIMFATFLEGPHVVTAFLSISKVVDGTAASIYEAIMEKVKECELDTSKFVSFGSDGASVMTGCNTGVAARLKKHVNPFITSIHCVAHRTNLCLEAAADFPDCEAMCSSIDALVNQVASFFSRSTNRLNLLTAMERELEYDELKAQGIQQTRWLSRHRAIKKLCDILEPILNVLKEESIALYDKLRDFKVIYVLHYLADILQKMTDLSLDFQKNYVDVTTIGSLCNNTIMEIEAEYLHVRPIDLNGFDLDSKGYPIIPDFGPQDFDSHQREGLLFALRGAVKGNMYRGVEMRRSILGEDLTAALLFQEAFARALVASLKDRMKEHELLSYLKVLAPVNMPQRSRELQKYGSDEIHKLADFFGRNKFVNGKEFQALINKDQFLKEFPKFRMQASTDWAGKSFADTWTMISCVETWALKYPELLKVARIGLVQCCSTAACERGFSRVNIVKVKYRNKLKSPAVDALVEGPSLENFDFSASIKHWESAAKFRHIYTGTREIEEVAATNDDELEFPIDIDEEEIENDEDVRSMMAAEEIS